VNDAAPIDPAEPALVPAERDALLVLARAAIEDEVSGSRAVTAALDRIAITPGLVAPRGAFVTLRQVAAGSAPGRLRGCIGRVQTRRELYRTVLEVAVQAAVADPRFAPLRPDELATVRLGVSVLGELQPVPDPAHLALGRDGVQLERGAHRALFLPEVAPEQGWTVERLLEQLALKAGLGRDAWRTARLSRFRTLRFGEPPG